MDRGQTQEGRQILVVEDHADSADLLQLILADEGYQVKCVETGKAALEVVTAKSADENFPFRPELILLDLRLPDMSGLELAEELRKRVAKSPAIILLSADPTYLIEEAARSIKATTIRKPFEFEELFLKVETALGEAASP
jgi:DNA-binding response OmpR family regulator